MSTARRHLLPKSSALGNAVSQSIPSKPAATPANHRRRRPAERRPSLANTLSAGTRSGTPASLPSSSMPSGSFAAIPRTTFQFPAARRRFLAGSQTQFRATPIRSTNNWLRSFIFPCLELQQAHGHASSTRTAHSRSDAVRYLGVLNSQRNSGRPQRRDPTRLDFLPENNYSLVRQLK